MSDGTLLSSLGGTSGTGNVTTEDAGFHNVTTTEGSSDVNVDGKYSYPNRDALQGKNYPFPAIIQQKDLSFSTATSPVYVYVHYGDWPIDGPYWETGRDSMDIFQDMNTEGEYSGYATKQFILNPGGQTLDPLTEADFTLDGAVAKVVKIDSVPDGTYFVTIEAVNTGTTTVKVTAAGYEADFTLEVTANIELTATPESLTLSERETDRTGEFVFTASSVTDAAHATAKQYGTADATDWEVIATEGRGSILSLEQNISDKNKWIVTRLGMGKVTLKVTFTYHYPSKEAAGAVELQKDVYVDVLQPDTVGLSDGYRYNVAYLGATATGTTTDYSFDKPSVAGRDFFLYLDSKTKELQGMNVKSIMVDGKTAMDIGVGTESVNIYRTTVTEGSEEGYYVELDKDVTVDSLYQYLAGNMYYLTIGSELAFKRDVTLEIAVRDGSNTYTLSITIPEVETCKKLTVTYQDGMGHSFTKVTLSGQRLLPTQEEVVAAGGGFTVPGGKKLVGWKLNGSDTVYPPGSAYIFTTDAAFTAVFGNTVTLNANGGKISSGGSAEDSYTFIVSDAPVSLAGYSSHTDRTGYELTGWKASETETYDVNKNIEPGALSGDLTLQAQWEPKKYTVRLKVDESDSSVREIKTTYDSSELSTVSYSTPAKEGHVLTGWAVKNGPRVITVNENGTLSLAAGVAGYTDSDGKWTRDVADNVLYAQWKQGYWLSLKNGESSLVYSEAIGSGTAGLDSGYVEAIDDIGYGEGWELDGWYTAKNIDSGQKVLDADGKVVNAVDDYSKAEGSDYVLELSGNKSLYACWKRTSTVYALTDSLTPGESYLIVNTDAIGNGRAFGRKYGYDQTNVQVEIKTGLQYYRAEPPQKGGSPFAEDKRKIAQRKWRFLPFGPGGVSGGGDGVGYHRGGCGQQSETGIQ